MKCVQDQNIIVCFILMLSFIFCLFTDIHSIVICRLQYVRMFDFPISCYTSIRISYIFTNTKFLLYAIIIWRAKYREKQTDLSVHVREREQGRVSLLCMCVCCTRMSVILSSLCSRRCYPPRLHFHDLAINSSILSIKSVFVLI